MIVRGLALTGVLILGACASSTGGSGSTPDTAQPAGNNVSQSYWFDELVLKPRRLATQHVTAPLVSHVSHVWNSGTGAG
jgi:hypothetical protein